MKVDSRSIEGGKVMMPLGAYLVSKRYVFIQDRFGVSWQIVPQQLDELLSKDTSGRVMQAMLEMVKIDIAQREQAYNGN